MPFDRDDTVTVIDFARAPRQPKPVDFEAAAAARVAALQWREGFLDLAVRRPLRSRLDLIGAQAIDEKLKIESYQSRLDPAPVIRTLLTLTIPVRKRRAARDHIYMFGFDSLSSAAARQGDGGPDYLSIIQTTDYGDLTCIARIDPNDRKTVSQALDSLMEAARARKLCGVIQTEGGARSSRPKNAPSHSIASLNP